MIKVNLLDSVTDKTRSVAVVEERVANPSARMWLLAVAVCAVTALGMAFDMMSANWAHSNAKAELERQQQIAAQTEAVNREQAELEKKIQGIQTRIEAIKKLRASQQGPVSILSSINERLPRINDFRLEAIEQLAGDLIIQGHSPNEAAVTQFGRSLEFSSGLFSNVSIETERKPLDAKDYDSKPGDGAIDPTAPKPETVKFKIKCKYTPPGSSSEPARPAATMVGVPPTQIAQK